MFLEDQTLITFFLGSQVSQLLTLMSFQSCILQDPLTGSTNYPDNYPDNLCSEDELEISDLLNSTGFHWETRVSRSLIFHMKTKMACRPNPLTKKERRHIYNCEDKR